MVRGLPLIKCDKGKICDACQHGKQSKCSFPLKKEVSTSRSLELLHLDLFGQTQVASLGGMIYCFVIIDDYSRFTWVYFLTHKYEIFNVFEAFCKMVENEKKSAILKIRSDHGGEFENSLFENFCSLNGYFHNFSAPRTPQQNGVVERKNRTLQEMARTMIHDYSLPRSFWAEAIHASCYIINRVTIRPMLKRTPYELYRCKVPNIAHFRPFGCSCHILKSGINLDKFEAKTDIGIFVGYSPNSKAYRVWNKRTSTIQESIQVKFDESNSATKPLVVSDTFAEDLENLQISDA